MAGAGGGAERRTSTRVDTHQHVVFSDQRATGPLRTGTAVDRSTGGLRIVTAFPEPVGSSIRIELQHASGGGVTLLEGRVMHVAQMESGLYAMGIRLDSRALRPHVPTRTAGGAAAERPRAAAARRLDVSVGTPGDTAGAAAATMSEEAVTFRRVNDRIQAGSWAALLGILALLLILAWLVMVALKEQQRRTSAPVDDAISSGDAFIAEHDVQRATEQWDHVGVYGARAIAQDASSTRRGSAGAPVASFASVRTPVSGLAEVSPALARAALELEDVRIDAPIQPPMSIDEFAAQLDNAQRACERG